jgi:hypothetical protein
LAPEKIEVVQRWADLSFSFQKLLWEKEKFISTQSRFNNF